LNTGGAAAVRGGSGETDGQAITSWLSFFPRMIGCLGTCPYPPHLGSWHGVRKFGIVQKNCQPFCQKNFGASFTTILAQNMLVSFSKLISGNNYKILINMNGLENTR
jgi:hypothetical protein